MTDKTYYEESWKECYDQYTLKVDTLTQLIQSIESQDNKYYEVLIEAPHKIIIAIYITRCYYTGRLRIIANHIIVKERKCGHGTQFLKTFVDECRLRNWNFVLCGPFHLGSRTIAERAGLYLNKCWDMDLTDEHIYRNIQDTDSR